MKKSLKKPQNFEKKDESTPLFKVFEIPKNFFQKVIWWGIGGNAPGVTYLQGLRPCTLLKGLLKKSLKKPQNFEKEEKINSFLKFLRFQRTFFKKFFGGGIGGNAPGITTRKGFAPGKSIPLVSFDQAVEDIDCFVGTGCQHERAASGGCSRNAVDIPGDLLF